ncbi:MAG: protein kinase [Methanoregula sp.]|jgi:parallel beta-helix repeat protein|nr:protein kinase [Methanoregula sp.]
MKSSFRSSCIWIAIICVICLLSPVAEGAERIVAPSGAEFVSIQDAIDWSISGETIVVQSGIYLENVRLTKKITLIGVDTGAGVPVISPSNKDPAIVVLADGCTVEGFSIQGSALSSGVRITSGNNTIEKNSIRRNGVGIILVSSAKNTIRGNEITESDDTGLVLERSTGNLVENNIIAKNTLGITLDEYSLSNTIVQNNFQNTQNVLSRSATSIWSSPLPFTFTHLGENLKSRMGNYWSDYRGIDANGDGIGDSPYSVSIGTNPKAIRESDQNSVDAFPLMDPKEYYSKVTPAPVVPVSPSWTVNPPLTPTVSGPTPSVKPTQSPLPAPGATSPVSLPFNLPAVSPLTLGLLLLVAVLAVAGGAYYLRKRRMAPVPPAEPAPGTAGGPEPGPHVVTKAASALKNAVEKTRSLMTIPSLRTVLSDTQDSEPKPSVTDQKNYFPRELENKYTEITFVGRGGIAWVFSAIRKTDGIKVAVKIPISFDEITGKCFLNEIAAWETLRHENIVEVTAVNILPVPYVEMEFVPGSLEALDKPLPVWKAVHLITLVVDGLRYAHEHGFIHRDLKPHNILLTDDVVPKITDWGMSKVLAAEVKKSSVAGFSLSYAAPEQVSPSEFGRTDERTDIYQLGVVFYELVTGSIPFGGESIVEVGNAILRESPTPPSEYNPDALAVEKIILKCLEKNPANRYQSAAELHDALIGYLDEDDE